MARTQLLVYGFGPDADFEGRLLGALERLESGGTLRILDTLFLRSDAATGELEDAVSQTGGAPLASEFSDATALAPELLARFLPNVTRRPGPEITPTG